MIEMAMQAESLEVLERADLPSPQARAIVRAIEIELAGAKDVLATKHDLVLLRGEMATKHDLDLLRGEMATKHDLDLLRGEMTDLRGEMSGLRGEMADLRGETVDLRAAMATKHDFILLRGEIGDVRGEMAVLRGDLRAEIHASVSGVTRQMYTALLGQMAVLLGFGYFFATQLAG